MPFRCLALLLFAALALFARGSWAGGAPRPNIVFILADDLGYTDVACYGSRFYETPHIDRLAAGGMRFTDAYTCGPNCQPTRAALMSGQYGPRTGVYTVGSINRFNWQSRPLRPVDNVESLPLERVTLAQALKGAGYATGMFGKWHLGQQGAHHPGQRGFDEAVVTTGQHFNFGTSPKTEYAAGTYQADFLTDRAVEFIRRHRERPFFLYLPHFGVHSPFDAKPDLVKRYEGRPAAGGHGNPTYAAMIQSVDESVGRVTALLDELNLSGKTLVIFSSDNGGVGGYAREGLRGAGGITDNAPLRGGKGMLYEGGIRVPFVCRWPGRIPAGRESREPVATVDLYPTFLELAGGKPPAGQPLDGVSFARLLGSGGARLDREALYWHFPGYLGAGANTWRTTPVSVVRAGEWKLMEFLEDGRRELYNLRADPGEKKNLAGEQPERAAALQARLAAWRKEIGAPMPARNPAAP